MRLLLLSRRWRQRLGDVPEYDFSPLLSQSNTLSLSPALSLCSDFSVFSAPLIFLFFVFFVFAFDFCFIDIFWRG